MRSAYVICALLGVAIGSLVLADNGAAQVATDAEVSKPPSNSPVEPSKNVPNDTKPDTTTAVPNITNATIISTNKPDAPTTLKPNTTTVISTTSTTPSNTTTNSTTHAPITTTTPNTTTTTTTAPKTTTSIPPPPTAVPTGSLHTTAVPSKPPSLPSKDRQFDGLSFFGGIILATCLMAIAAFSWKFYRQCNEGNYRTL